jgi:hypothetical protein
MLSESQSQKKVIVKKSKFTNLNYGRVLHGLQSIKNEFSENKGIVCNIDGFDGEIQFLGNTINENMVFIPSAIFSNA